MHRIALIPPLLLAIASGACEGLPDDAAEPDMGGEPLPPHLKRENPVSIGGTMPASPPGGEVSAIPRALSGEWFMSAHGGGGSLFAFKPQPTWRLIHIYIKTGNYLDSIEVWWVDPAGNQHWSGRAGGSGGYGRNIAVNANAPIDGLIGNSGAYVDRIGFQTPPSNGAEVFGGGGGYPFWDNIRPLGRTIQGFHGGSGKYVDRLGGIAYLP
jgi:hypothetical protein